MKRSKEELCNNDKLCGGRGAGGKTLEKCVKVSTVGQLVSEKYM
jgi:hypothetical protein